MFNYLETNRLNIFRQPRPRPFIFIIFLIFIAFLREKTGTRWIGGGAEDSEAKK
jgi:hypothetical protein